MKFALTIMTLIFASTVFATEHETAPAGTEEGAQVEAPATDAAAAPMKKEHKKKKKAKKAKPAH